MTKRVLLIIAWAIFILVFGIFFSEWSYSFWHLFSPDGWQFLTHELNEAYVISSAVIGALIAAAPFVYIWFSKKEKWSIYLSLGSGILSFMWYGLMSGGYLIVIAD